METVWKYTVGIVVMLVVAGGAVLAYYAFLALCLIGIIDMVTS